MCGHQHSRKPLQPAETAKVKRKGWAPRCITTMETGEVLLVCNGPLPNYSSSLWTKQEMNIFSGWHRSGTFQYEKGWGYLTEIHTVDLSNLSLALLLLFYWFHSLAVQILSQVLSAYLSAAWNVSVGTAVSRNVIRCCCAGLTVHCCLPWGPGPRDCERKAYQFL